MLASSCQLGPGDSRLHDAIGENDISKVASALEDGNDPNEVWLGEPAVHGAAGVGSVPILRLLLDAGADPLALTDEGDTAIVQVANHSGNVEVAELLLDVGVDPCVEPSDWLQELLGIETLEDVLKLRGHEELGVYLNPALEACPSS